MDNEVDQGNVDKDCCWHLWLTRWLVVWLVGAVCWTGGWDISSCACWGEWIILRKRKGVRKWSEKWDESTKCRHQSFYAVSVPIGAILSMGALECCRSVNMTRGSQVTGRLCLIFPIYVYNISFPRLWGRFLVNLLAPVRDRCCALVVISMAVGAVEDAIRSHRQLIMITSCNVVESDSWRSL